jgi:hypothetical protein
MNRLRRTDFNLDACLISTAANRIDSALLYFLLTTLVSFFVFKKILSSQKNAKFAIARGCKPAPAYPQVKWLNGFDVLPMLLRWRSERKFFRQTGELFKTAGSTFSVRILGTTRVWTIQPENVKAILHSSDFEKGANFMKAFRPFTGDGAVTSNGEVWAHGRALLRPCSTKAQVENLELYERHLQNFIALVPRNGETVDLQKLLYALALDASSEFLLGESAGSLLPGAAKAKEAEELDKAFDYTTKVVVDRYNMGWLIYFHWDPKFNWAIKVIERLHAEVRRQSSPVSRITVTVQSKDRHQDRRGQKIISREWQKHEGHPHSTQTRYLHRRARQADQRSQNPARSSHHPLLR